MVELSLAPMMKVTTPQFRTLIRQTSRTTLLFTEMVVASTVIHADPKKIDIILGEPEDLTVVQVGGSDPTQVAQAVRILKNRGWALFNLNCGCPSDRVKSGMFGAILMLDKVRVAKIINEVYNTTGIVLSLKIRTGVDEHDSFEFFRDFVEYISTDTPCFKFYVHARKCWLNGVSPKHNRTVPSLNYQFVYDIKKIFPNLFFSLNGGIKENELHKIGNLDGIMIGRAAWDNIKIFSEYENNIIDMKDVIRRYLDALIPSNPVKSKVLMPLNNLRKGLLLNRIFKQTINELIRNDVKIEELYVTLEKFID